jgi:hypothetical protein
MDKYTVSHNGKAVTINSALVQLQHIDDDTLEHIKQTHVTRLKMFESAEDAVTRGDIDGLRALATEFEALEFEQQALWGFPQDSSYHMWFTFPGCTCAKMDNMDRRGTPYRLIDVACPVHGNRGE